MTTNRQTQVRRLSRLGRTAAALALALAAATAPAFAQERLPPPEDPSAGLPPEAIYTETVIAKGEKWRLVDATGYAADDGAGYFNRRLYMIQDADGVRNAPLPAG